MRLLYLAAGGVLGTLSRYWLAGVVQEKAGPGFPFGTFAVNTLGCLAAGLIVSSQVSSETKFLFTVGFCGAFTTFSAMMLDTRTLVQGGQTAQAALYIAASLACGMAALLAGAWMGNKI